MHNYLVEFGLFLTGQNCAYIILVLGLCFIDRKKFSFILASYLFIIIIGQMLKFLWQIPLNFAITGHHGFAYPSGHTLACASLWFLIYYEFRKKWVLIPASVVLLIGVNGIVQKGYHDWLEVIGGFAAAGLCVTPIQLAEKWINREKLYGLYILLATIVYSALLLRSPFLYNYLLQCIGLIMVIALLHKEIFNFETIAEKALNCLVASLLLILCQKIKVIIWPLNEFTLILEWSLLGAMIFFVVPLLIKANK